MVVMRLSGLRNRWKPKHQTEIQGPGKESVGMHSATSIGQKSMVTADLETEEHGWVAADMLLLTWEAEADRCLYV